MTTGRRLQGLIQYDSNLPVVWDSLNQNRTYRALLSLSQDYMSQNIISNPVDSFSIQSDSVTDRSKILLSSNVSQSMPRYIDIN